MNNDKCQLVAWTEGGNVKMSLDLIKEMSQEYLERIKSLESTVYKRHKAGEEVPFILAQLRAGGVRKLSERVRPYIPGAQAVHRSLKCLHFRQ